jgi:hypothetical protein
MHRSLRSILALAAAVCAFASAAAYPVYETARRCWHHTCRWLSIGFEWVVSRVRVESPKNPASPRRALIGAAQFLGRIMRRERPLVSPRWRLCPSV